MTTPRFVPGHQPPARDREGALLFVARGLELLIQEREGTPGLPTCASLPALAEGAEYLGTLDGTDCYAAALPRDASPPEGMRLVPGRALYKRVDEVTFAVAGRALAIAEWDATHRFCGRCATPTERLPGERSRRCPACHLPFYPRISPAIIVLVTRGERMLLARSSRFPEPFFSTLAGFVEPGESLEETAVREVKEEVGVDIHRLRYFGSQPWPFGRSLMVGFTAEYAGGELRVDGEEIVEADWFTADRLPRIPPRLSIARHLIDGFLETVRAASEGPGGPGGMPPG